MALSTSTMRGLIRYLPGTGKSKGAAVPRLIIHPGDTTPVYEPFYIRPTEVPSGTLAEGAIWFDDDNHTLAFFDGTDNVEVVKTTSTGDLTVSDDLNVGDDLNLTSTGAIITIGPAATDPVILTQSANTLTVASGDTIAVTTADKLTVGGTIVPATIYESFRVGPHATVTEYDLMIAHRAITVTGIQVVPSTLQGGALTATICKCTGTAAPANGTTPMHTANAIDLNAGAYTVQTISLTGTAADLTLAAGNRIGIDYSAALTAGHAVVTIAYKYV